MGTLARKTGFCTLCRSRCGATYVLDGERMVGVEPLPGHPTGGALCAKGRAAPELIYHPKRLTTPLKRTRPKTEADPGWVPVSWDEALSDIAQRLLAIKQESGAEAVAFSAASPGATPISDSLDWIERLIHGFGSPNFITGVEICNWHRDHTHALTFGHGIGMPDYAHSELVLLWGFNPGNVWLAQANALAKARARGAKLVVIDPSRTRHARDADQWLRVAPGTDAALALGLARWLITHDAFDDAFVRGWTNAPFLVRDDNGLLLRAQDADPHAAPDHFMAMAEATGRLVSIDTSRALPPDEAATLALRGAVDVTLADVAGSPRTVRCRPAFDHYAAACSTFTPEHVERLTGIPVAQLETTAQAIAAARSVSYYCWTGISQHVNAAQTDRAIALLYALTGHVDAPGGNLQLSGQPANAVNARSVLPEGQAEKALGLDRLPLGPPAFGWVLGRDVYRAVLQAQPYRVRALVSFGANLLVSQADTQQARQAFEQLEFQVHCDLFETPTGRFADYLLPVNTPWEREGLRIGFDTSAQGLELVQLRQPIVPAQSAARSDLDIVFALGTRLGLGALFFGGSIEAGWNHQLAPLGLTVDRLRRHPEGMSVPIRQQARRYAQPMARVDTSGPPSATASCARVHGFATPTRRIEIYSEQMHRHGLPPVPVWVDPLAAASLSSDELARFPLKLGSAKSGFYCHSQHRALPSLRGREPDASAGIHPQLAARHGLHAGDWMRIETRNGAARFRVRLDDALADDVVVASHGFWQACDDLGLAGFDPTAAGNSHLNGLMSGERLDPLSGSIPLRSFPCRIDIDDAAAARGWDGWKAFQVDAIEMAGDHVRVLTLHAADGALLPDYRPGQHVALRVGLQTALETGLPGPQAFHERHYSLIGPAADNARHGYRIAVKRVDADDGESSAQPGIVSTHLHRSLRVGDTVQLKTPNGRFLLPARTDTPVVLIAAGIGITPFMSLLESLALDNGGMPELLLLHVNRDPAHHPFKQRIEALHAQLPRLSVRHFYSRAAGVHGDEPAQPRTTIHAGRVSAASIDQDLIDRNARFYLCGPPPMLRELTDGLVARGVHRFAIFQESFQPPRRDSPASAGPFRIRFSRSHTELIWTPASGSLLELGLSHGLDLPSGCRVGQCESCALHVTAGRFEHATDDADLADDRCLACIAHPSSDMVVDA